MVEDNILLFNPPKKVQIKTKGTEISTCSVGVNDTRVELLINGGILSIDPVFACTLGASLTVAAAQVLNKRLKEGDKK